MAVGPGHQGLPPSRAVRTRCTCSGEPPWLESGPAGMAASTAALLALFCTHRHRHRRRACGHPPPRPPAPEGVEALLGCRLDTAGWPYPPLFRARMNKRRGPNQHLPPTNIGLLGTPGNLSPAAGDNRPHLQDGRGAELFRLQAGYGQHPCCCVRTTVDFSSRSLLPFRRPWRWQEGNHSAPAAACQ